jgi:ribosome modulation factor
VRVLAREAGYQAALVGRGRSNSRWTNPQTLMRIAVDVDTTVDALAQRLNRSRWLAGI